MTICTVGSPCLLLLLENDAQFVEMFRLQLDMERERRFRVVPIGTLAEMAALIATHDNIDAVILDLGLAESSGAETLQRALAITAHRIPLIVLTGDGELTEETALEMGAAAFCEKTQVTQHALLKIIRQAIAHQRFVVRLLGLTADYDAHAGEGVTAAENLTQGIRALLHSVGAGV